MKVLERNALTIGSGSLKVMPDLVDTSEKLVTKDELEDFITQLLSRSPIVKHECHSCGAVLEIDANKHVFRCSYCGSVYAIGTNMIHS